MTGWPANGLIEFGPAGPYSLSDLLADQHLEPAGGARWTAHARPPSLRENWCCPLLRRTPAFALLFVPCLVLVPLVPPRQGDEETQALGHLGCPTRVYNTWVSAPPGGTCEGGQTERPKTRFTLCTLEPHRRRANLLHPTHPRPYHRPLPRTLAPHWLARSTDTAVSTLRAARVWAEPHTPAGNPAKTAVHQHWRQEAPLRAKGTGHAVARRARALT